jgi:hypothetical protein
MDVRSSTRSLRGIPFQRHPWAAVVLAVAMFCAVFVLRLAVEGSSDHITSLFVLPIALLAVAFGMWAGASAGAVGVLLVFVWVWADGVSLTPLGWFGRVVPLLLLGVLVGQAADRLRAAAATEEALFASRLREREAAEINDGIVQRLVAAKWSLEADQPDRALETLTETIETAESLVVALLRGQRFRSGPPAAIEELDDIRTVAAK